MIYANLPGFCKIVIFPLPVGELIELLLWQTKPSQMLMQNSEVQIRIVCS